MEDYEIIETIRYEDVISYIQQFIKDNKLVPNIVSNLLVEINSVCHIPNSQTPAINIIYNKNDVITYLNNRQINDIPKMRQY